MSSKVSFYNAKAKTYNNLDNEAALRYKRALGLAELKKGAKILDIGCKDGFLLRYLKAESINVEYYGMDISEVVLQKIASYDSQHFKVGDVCKGIPFADNYFDYIFALEIMEHVESPTLMLKEVRRVLKDDGIFIISVPNPYCYREIVENLLHKNDTEGHISSFTYQTIKRLFEFNNLEIKDSCGTFFRIPFSVRISKNGSYKITSSNNLFLTRSFIYKVVLK